ncbi:GL16981 [Drosophila persimilis]|uniref:GL16981 n=1 Tax=Drosophila persimilis TaxID=7234 RepID=B4GHA2_DROPE|nr:GL16981 [Drosophila persimilis]
MTRSPGSMGIAVLILFCLAAAASASSASSSSDTGYVKHDNMKDFRGGNASYLYLAQCDAFLNPSAQHIVHLLLALNLPFRRLRDTTTGFSSSAAQRSAA